MRFAASTVLFLCTAGALSPSGMAEDDAVREFRRWFDRYRHGRVALHEPVESGFHSRDASGARTTRYFRTDAVDEMTGLLERLVESNDAEAARILLDAAVYRAHGDSAEERRRFVARQPWLVRHMAQDALGRLSSDDGREFLRGAALLDRSPIDGADRRVAALLAVSRMGDTAAIPAITRRLADEVPAVRIAAARALGRYPDPSLLEPLEAAFRDEDARVRLEALMAAESVVDSNPLIPDERILALARRAIGDTSWAIRHAATQVFRRHPSRESVPTLVRAIVDEAPGKAGSRRRVRTALRDALGTLTGEDFPSYRPEDWAQWWESTAAEFDLAENSLHDVAPEQGARFFGVPIEGDEVIFLLDVSGSMKLPPPHDDGGPSRLFLAVREMRRCVEALEDGTRFNILLFNDSLVPFRSAPIEKTPAAVEEAKAFLEGIEPQGGTDLYAALEFALALSGSETRPGREIDTIVLLTDGQPSRGVVLIPDEILHQVTDQNRMRRIAIHTVATGTGRNKFLARIAAENFGQSSELAD